MSVFEIGVDRSSAIQTTFDSLASFDYDQASGRCRTPTHKGSIKAEKHRSAPASTLVEERP